ncbi:MAG: hypothetical protein WD989_02235, partial [Candidatus Paceibacterota bacterium]
MPRSKYQVISAIFDIKPVNEVGEIDAEKLSGVELVLNLGRKLRIGKSGKMVFKNQKAPTDATSRELMNSVGAARSVTSPANHLKYSVSQPKLKSSEDVDNQKPRFDEVIGSVEDRGFAPLDSQVVNQGRHYASPTVKSSYQEKMNQQDELEQYLNEDTVSEIELAAIGAEVFEKKDARPRYMPIPTIRSKGQVVSSKQEVVRSKEDETEKENYDAVLRQINEKVAFIDPNMPVGEPKRTDIIDWW